MDKDHGKNSLHKGHKNHGLLERLLELILGTREERAHAPRGELHEDSHLHPHHHQADHARHHHRPHILHHHGKETLEEKKFVDQENRLHRVEMTREVWEDAAGRRMLRKTEKASATPSHAQDSDAYTKASATPSQRKKGPKVKSSSSMKVAEQLSNIRLRIAFARAKTRERGEMVFGK